MRLGEGHVLVVDAAGVVVSDPGGDCHDAGVSHVLGGAERRTRKVGVDSSDNAHKKEGEDEECALAEHSYRDTGNDDGVTGTEK